jgi:LacI family transcriptional regulator
MTNLKKVNLKDVATYAGVSYATVSNVIHGKNIVKEETKCKVLKAIETLNYYPDLIARSMKKGRTFNIGLIVSDLSNPFYAESSKVIVKTAEKYNCHVTLCVTEEKTSKMDEYIDLLITMRVDGVIIGSYLKTDSFERLRKNDIPYVLFSRKDRDGECDFIVLNNVKGAQDAVSHLIQLGHKRIGLIHGPTQFDTMEGRVKGYYQAMNAHKMKVHSDFIQEVGINEMETNLEPLINKMFEKEMKPTAFFATGDHLALDAMEILIQKNLRVPEDVALVGFDNIRFSGHSFIGLTTVGHRAIEMASLATERLMQKIENKDNPEFLSKPWQITLDPELIIRRSSGGSLAVR